MPTSKNPFKHRAKPVHPSKPPKRASAPPPSKKPLFPFFRKPEEPDIDLITGSTTLLDILSPASVDLTRRDVVELDGVYNSYLYIAGYGYNTAVGSGWLS
ncbi:MAG: hypothetical protein LBK23_10930, partial [Oscillospiraceae bacterium]|nr:hypothetical protein [Oscillospiraceae bacterium]